MFLRLVVSSTLLSNMSSMAFFSPRATLQQAFLTTTLLRPSAESSNEASGAGLLTRLKLSSQTDIDEGITIQPEPTKDSMQFFSTKDNQDDCDHDRESNPKMPSNELVEQFESEFCYGKGKATLSIVVQGACGDLAKKMTFPALFDLYANGFIPSNAIIVGYARSDKSDDHLRDQLRPFLEETMEGIQCGQKKLDAFLERIRYVKGGSNEEDMQGLVYQVSKRKRKRAATVAT